MELRESSCDVVVVGAGLAGIASAYFLGRAGVKRVALVDQLPPMSFTTAQSGDNFRNWWPHPTMTAFTDASIDVMQNLSQQADIDFHANGYVLLSRDPDPSEMVQRLLRGYGSGGDRQIRVHRCRADSYFAAGSSADGKPGVDVLAGTSLVKKAFPHLAPDFRLAAHVRRAGYLGGQLMGQELLSRARENGLQRIRGRADSLAHSGRFRLKLDDGTEIHADQLVIAAGPFVNDLVGQIEEPLPVRNVLQQKLAFTDTLGAVPRNQPFSIDLDPLPLDWSDEERELLAGEPELAWMAQELPGGAHCRPEGKGQWIKLGWAFNRDVSVPELEPPLDESFPELVVRRAGMVNPALLPYREQLPSQRSHYGGYYTMTEENWPLIGPLRTPGAFVVGALSGFGTMAACAAGSLCADWVTGAALPAYARSLSLQRYQDSKLMADLRADADKGIV
ncbi:MAG: FAD-binding oxidoreductase [Xanthomonadales bacterium]|nr:FAD-binding oxidoreductase [Xanthomonadales bacterium]